MFWHFLFFYCPTQDPVRLEQHFYLRDVSNYCPTTSSLYVPNYCDFSWTPHHYPTPFTLTSTRTPPPLSSNDPLKGPRPLSLGLPPPRKPSWPRTVPTDGHHSCLSGFSTQWINLRPTNGSRRRMLLFVSPLQFPYVGLVTPFGRRIIDPTFYSCLRQVRCRARDFLYYRTGHHGSQHQTFA